MEPTQALGFAHFLEQTDAIARVMLALLLVMSLATWYLIATKSIAHWLERRRDAQVLDQLARDAQSAAARGERQLSRALRRAIESRSAALESGLTMLASIGSTAPFIGLFGTVWGVYHALVSIGVSGQGTLDKVAGPVGEALIMTALGLAVAIPAVLAYNGFIRANRVLIGRLDARARDLFAELAPGQGGA